MGRKDNDFAAGNAGFNTGGAWNRLGLDLFNQRRKRHEDSLKEHKELMARVAANREAKARAALAQRAAKAEAAKAKKLAAAAAQAAKIAGKQGSRADVQVAAAPVSKPGRRRVQLPTTISFDARGWFVYEYRKQLKSTLAFVGAVFAAILCVRSGWQIGGPGKVATLKALGASGIVGAVVGCMVGASIPWVTFVLWSVLVCALRIVLGLAVAAGIILGLAWLGTR